MVSSLLVLVNTIIKEEVVSSRKLSVLWKGLKDWLQEFEASHLSLFQDIDFSGDHNNIKIAEPLYILLKNIHLLDIGILVISSQLVLLVIFVCCSIFFNLFLYSSTCFPSSFQSFSHSSKFLSCSSILFFHSISCSSYFVTHVTKISYFLSRISPLSICFSWYWQLFLFSQLFSILFKLSITWYPYCFDVSSWYP